MSNHLEVGIASGDALDVRDFSVVESISTLFSVTLTAGSATTATLTGASGITSDGGTGAAPRRRRGTRRLPRAASAAEVSVVLTRTGSSWKSPFVGSSDTGSPQTTRIARETAASRQWLRASIHVASQGSQPDVQQAILVIVQHRTHRRIRHREQFSYIP